MVRRTTAGAVAVAVATLLTVGVPASATLTPTPSPAPTRSSSSAPPRSTGTPTTKPEPSASPSPSRTGDAAKPGGGTSAAAPDPHDDAALVAAARALQAAQDDLVTARASLSSAREELATARAAEAQAQSDLRAAVMAEAQVTRDLQLLEARMLGHTTALGRLARATYQSSGPLGDWQLVLELQSPDQLADRLAAMQSVASAGNAVISDLHDDRADLENTQSQLAAARRHQEEVRAQARRALADTVGKERAAAAAEKQVGVVVAARQDALADAADAVAADRKHYRAMLVESGALSQRIQQLAAKLANTSRPPHGTGQFMRPGRGEVTSPYGMRYHPILHYVKLHTGTDFAAADGVAHAADDGVVLLTEYNVAYGNMTVIDHGTIGGLHVTTLYAHQSAFAVAPGDRVSKGQVIGLIGATGYATGPHLHFEVRIDGRPTDPAPWIEAAPLPAGLPSPIARLRSVT
ncbi:MAG: hypothetical protein QOI54_3016 [Actinomycetota bacterium]|nr:hypothetical protein [Actinomycetota bacterium]